MPTVNQNLTPPFNLIETRDSRPEPDSAQALASLAPAAFASAHH